MIELASYIETKNTKRMFARDIDLCMEFYEPGTFHSMYAAQRWLKENGYSVGSTCFKSYCGILKGDFIIAKWKNLTPDEIKQLDGVMWSSDYREGVVQVVIFKQNN